MVRRYPPTPHPNPAVDPMIEKDLPIETAGS
jgi:hypothetical protein